MPTDSKPVCPLAWSLDQALWSGPGRPAVRYLQFRECPGHQTEIYSAIQTVCTRLRVSGVAQMLAQLKAARHSYCTRVSTCSWHTGCASRECIPGTSNHGRQYIWYCFTTEECVLAGPIGLISGTTKKAAEFCKAVCLIQLALATCMFTCRGCFLDSTKFFGEPGMMQDAL